MEEGIRGDVKIIWYFLSKYKKEFYLIFFVVFFSSILGALAPYIYGKVVTSVIADGLTSSIFAWLILGFILSLVQILANRYRYVHGSRVSLKCRNDLVLSLNRHSVNLLLSYHNKNKSGKLSSRYISAANALDEILKTIVFWLGSDIMMMVVALLFIGLYVNWIIFFVFVFCIALYLYVSIKYTLPAHEYITAGSKSY